jgi:putative SOS response-associated peptidase YedK
MAEIRSWNTDLIRNTRAAVAIAVLVEALADQGGQIIESFTVLTTTANERANSFKTDAVKFPSLRTTHLA